MKGLKIKAGEYGGYAVLSWNSYGDSIDFLFSGSLDECLAFMKSRSEAARNKCS